RRVIARASRCTRRSIFSIVRPYSTARTSLNVYAPDISYVYDTLSSPVDGPDRMMLSSRRGFSNGRSDN
ncbi:MAG: hypothetical protein ACLQU2_01470, partial [Candidatus Binataceae bacterium]